MNIRQALKQAVAKISPLDARVLLAHILDKEQSFLIANDDFEIQPILKNKFLNAVGERENNRPVAQIIGHKEFWGMDFLVDENTLTPRPETELIIETALELFPDKTTPLKILDLGTGTGCIILSLLSEYKNATGVAVDFSTKALAIAEKNAYNLSIKRVEFVHSNWFENVKSEKFDLIVSNPPYVETSWLEAEGSIKFEPELALNGGEDGLKDYREIAEQLRKLETDSEFNFGKIIFEIGENQEDAVKNIFTSHGLSWNFTRNDLAEIPRIVVFSK